MIYGISPYDLKTQRDKISRQRDFLSKQSFLTQNGELKSYLDISMSANLSTRYYAQLANKVNTLQQVMQNDDLTPVFLTITLDGVYHDLINGDYSRFSLFHQKKLPNNQVNGFLQEKASNREIFTPRDLYQIIRFQWSSFQNSLYYRKIKKNGYKVGYLFSTEPHKSGVPHAHILLYVPEFYVKGLLELFKTKFWAKQNISQDKKRLSPDQIRNGEINGFQWTLTNPVGYVMKYCTKSFIDLKNQTEIDELQAWYTKYKIIRITMSHSLVPQWVYNKIYPLNKDWLYLTKLKNDYSFEWSKEDDYFEAKDDNLNKIFRYERGLYQMFINDKLVDQFGEKKPKKIINTCKVTQKPCLRQKIIKCPVIYDGIKLFYNGKDVSKTKFSLKYTSTYELYSIYLKMDIETIDSKYYCLISNELIKRGFIKGDIKNVNDFNDDFSFVDLLSLKFNSQRVKKYQEINNNFIHNQLNDFDKKFTINEIY
jgi:hypothetical protein